MMRKLVSRDIMRTCELVSWFSIIIMKYRVNAVMYCIMYCTYF